MISDRFGQAQCESDSRIRTGWCWRGRHVAAFFAARAPLPGKRKQSGGRRNETSDADSRQAAA